MPLGYDNRVPAKKANRKEKCMETLCRSDFSGGHKRVSEDGWLIQASFRKELTKKWIVESTPHLWEIPSLLDPVNDGGTGARVQSAVIKDTEGDNLLRLVNINLITRSKMGGNVHQMQKLSAFELTRIQGNLTVVNSSNPLDWLAFNVSYGGRERNDHRGCILVDHQKVN